MPTTLEPPKRSNRRITYYPGVKQQGLKPKVIKVLAGQPVSGMTIREIVAATDQHPPAADAAKLKLRAEVAALREQLQAKLQALNAAEVPAVILPQLHDGKTGRIDAQAVADFMGVPLKRLAEGLALDYKAVHRNPSAAGFQTALQPVKRALEILHKFFVQPEIIRAWLNTPHPDLDGTTALETILENKAEAVQTLLENAWNGVPV